MKLLLFRMVTNDLMRTVQSFTLNRPTARRGKEMWITAPKKISLHSQRTGTIVIVSSLRCVYQCVHTFSLSLAHFCSLVPVFDFRNIIHKLGKCSDFAKCQQALLRFWFCLFALFFKKMHTKRCWIKNNPICDSVLGKIWTDPMLGCFDSTGLGWWFDLTYWVMAITQRLGEIDPKLGHLKFSNLGWKIGWNL